MVADHQGGEHQGGINLSSPAIQGENAMKLPRRKFLHLAAGAAALPVLPRVAWAQAYPSRPVRIVLGFPAGGTTDIGARLIAQWLADRLGQPFVVENRPGAGTHVATEAVVRAPADGYTLLMATGSNAINATLYDKLNYDFIRDIAPVAGVIRSPYVLEVHPTLPIRSVPELIAYAKSNPGKINMASFGTGTGSHLSGELLKIMTGIEMLHVPYRGSAPMLIDLIGGQVQLAFDNLPASIEHIRAGKLRPLAVGTAIRSEALPDVPTMGEFLPGFESSAWIGVGAPRNTSPAIVDKLNREINAALADPKIKTRLAELSGIVLAGSPADFGRHIAQETEKWGKVIRAANIKPE
jgi:tripartite-type tricarboxylate transporter receptor subunit TctC